MFQFKHDFNDQYCGARGIPATRALNPELQCFDAWLKTHTHLIPLE